MALFLLRRDAPTYPIELVATYHLKGSGTARVVPHITFCYIGSDPFLILPSCQGPKDIQDKLNGLIQQALSNEENRLRREGMDLKNYQRFVKRASEDLSNLYSKNIVSVRRQWTWGIGCYILDCDLRPQCLYALEVKSPLSAGERTTLSNLYQKVQDLQAQRDKGQISSRQCLNELMPLQSEIAPLRDRESLTEVTALLPQDIDEVLIIVKEWPSPELLQDALVWARRIRYTKYLLFSFAYGLLYDEKAASMLVNEIMEFDKNARERAIKSIKQQENTHDPQGICSIGAWLRYMFSYITEQTNKEPIYPRNSKVAEPLRQGDADDTVFYKLLGIMGEGKELGLEYRIPYIMYGLCRARVRRVRGFEGFRRALSDLWSDIRSFLGFPSHIERSPLEILAGPKDRERNLTVIAWALSAFEGKEINTAEVKRRIEKAEEWLNEKLTDWENQRNARRQSGGAK